jgi:hypothetical protein
MNVADTLFTFSNASLPAQSPFEASRHCGRLDGFALGNFIAPSRGGRIVAISEAIPKSGSSLTALGAGIHSAWDQTF